MRKTHFLILSTFILFSLIFLFISDDSVATQKGDIIQEGYIPNEVLVKFKKHVGRYFIQDAVNSVQGKVITYLSEEISTLQWDPDIYSFRSFRLDPDLLHIRVPETVGTEQAIYILSLNPNVEYAEKNLIFHVFVDPNDPEFTRLWGLKNTGQTGGEYDADIDADLAWNIYTGSSDTVVAVIDTGVDYNHIDLQANIWINPGESGGGKETNGIDDDNNGYIDDFRGWDFRTGNPSNPEDNDPMDEYYPKYHGTHVAGTVGAVGNNDEGVTGVSWDVKIMALKIFDAVGHTSSSAEINAIDYSTENGAHLSNNSWGGGGYSQSLSDAIGRAKDAGKLFIAAAGNNPPLDNDQNPVYPASYEHENIIAVLSTDHDDNISSFSHYGLTSVDIGAPGGSGTGGAEDIYSTRRYNDYRYLSGTSMASPHVAGVDF